MPEKFVHEGKTLAQIAVPKDAVVVSVTRAGELLIPRGDTCVKEGDRVVVLAKNTAFHELAKNWRLTDV